MYQLLQSNAISFSATQVTSRLLEAERRKLIVLERELQARLCRTTSQAVSTLMLG